MRYLSSGAALAAAATLLAAPVAAQTSPPAPGPFPTPAPAPAPAAAPAAEAAAKPACCTIPALTPIEIELTQPVSSKDNKNGDAFTFRLAAPIMVDGQVAVPAGTPGVGEVVHAAKARAMGKAGELILAARYLTLGDRRIALRTFRYGRSQGKDPSGSLMVANTMAAAVLPVAGLASFLITGGEVRVPAGTRATAKITAETIVAPANR